MPVNNSSNPREQLNNFGAEARPEGGASESKVLQPVEAESVLIESNKTKTGKVETKKVIPQKFFTKKSQAAQAAPAVANDPKVLAIKNVLGKGLGPVYSKMDQQHQADFLTAEETAAAKIKEVLATEPVKSRKIFKIIFDWLKTIPLVSKFFIKQEAKIKTDQIVDLGKRK